MEASSDPDPGITLEDIKRFFADSDPNNAMDLITTQIVPELSLADDEIAVVEYAFHLVYLRRMIAQKLRSMEWNHPQRDDIKFSVRNVEIVDCQMIFSIEYRVVDPRLSTTRGGSFKLEFIDITLSFSLAPFRVWMVKPERHDDLGFEEDFLLAPSFHHSGWRTNFSINTIENLKKIMLFTYERHWKNERFKMEAAAAQEQP